MSENDSKDVLEALKTVTRLMWQKRSDEAKAILIKAIEERGEDSVVIREIINQIGPFPFFADVCFSLISDYVRLNPDIETYDESLIRTMVDSATATGRWAAAAQAQRHVITRSGAFSLDQWLSLAALLSYDGQHNEADRIVGTALAQASERLARLRPEVAGARLRLCVPVGSARTVARAIGEMAFQFDFFLKGRALGWLDGQDAAFIVDHRLVCNPTLLDYFKAKVPVLKASEIEHRKGLRVIAECRNTFEAVVVPKLGGVNRFVGYAMMLDAWAGQGRPPTLTLKPCHRAEGYGVLAALGFAEGDWFVGLHVRERGWQGEQENGYNAFRCADIADYLPMIHAITARGGWVVRLGDASMAPLPPMERVFDYALSAAKSDWMDVFLCGAARFVVGTQSGIVAVAKAFSTPVVFTNGLPLEAFPLDPGDIIILQKLFSRQQNRPLNIIECFSPPVVDQHLRYFFDREGILPEPNTPDEITDAALQMIDQLEGRTPLDTNQQALAARFDAATRVHGHGFRYRPGRRYLKAIEAQLPLA